MSFYKTHRDLLLQRLDYWTEEVARAVRQGNKSYQRSCERLLARVEEELKETV